jgi:hypothetical protein
MQPLYLSLTDAAQHAGTTERHLIHLGATARLPIYVRPIGRRIQAVVDFSRYGKPYLLDGLLHIFHTDIAKLEAGCEYVLLTFFVGCHYIVPPIGMPRSKSDPPPPPIDRMSFVIDGDPLVLKKEHLVVMTRDLEPLTSGRESTQRQLSELREKPELTEATIGRFSGPRSDCAAPTENRDEELQDSANLLAKKWRQEGRKNFSKRDIAHELSINDEWREMTAIRIERLIRVKW